jgi:hypothetical protein
MRKLLLATAASMGALLAATSGAMAQPVKPVAAGTVSVHLNGYLQFEIGAQGSTFNTVGGNKLNTVATDGEVRLYPGFDGQTIEGIDYGVQVELRTSATNAGKGVNGNATASNGNGTGGLYVRRAYGYLGTPDAGFVRFGQTDSVYGLMQNGVLEAYGDGNQWPADGGPVSILPTHAVPGEFIYADQGSLYATDKIVYISPAYTDPLLGGAANAGIGFEPSSNGFKQGYANCTVAGSTCSALVASSTPGDVNGTRRKDTVDVMAQYLLKADGFASKFSGGYLHGSPVTYNGVPQESGPLVHGYDDLNAYQFGAQTTYAGLTLGANVKGGAIEDGYAMKPKGARNALAYIVGATYVIGPYVVGASYFNSQSSGAYDPTKAGKEARTLSEYGFTAGGNYVLARQMNLFVEYMYGHAHQPGNTNLSAMGNTQAQIVTAGATIKW